MGCEADVSNIPMPICMLIGWQLMLSVGNSTSNELR